MKSHTGYVYLDSKKRWTARITYTEEGRRRNIERRAKPNTKNRAKEILKALVAMFENSGGSALKNERMTFGQLASHYTENYLRPAEYREGRKLAGLRSPQTPEYFLGRLKARFGLRAVRSITYGELREYKNVVLNTPTVRTKRLPAVATVNRELALFRRVLNVAVREGWLLRNPFNAGESLITAADETKRERIIDREEEQRLLNACGGRRAHLRPIVICALDTGMRRGELLKLQWADVDFGAGLITVRALNTKTLHTRVVAMSARVEGELRRLCGDGEAAPDAFVFDGVADVKHSFGTARKKAGLPDLRFHDLRHTAATRLVSQHIPLSEVGRVLGHTQANTTYRYVNANVEAARRAAAAMDGFHLNAIVEEVGEHLN